MNPMIEHNNGNDLDQLQCREASVERSDVVPDRGHHQIEKRAVYGVSGIQMFVAVFVTFSKMATASVNG